MIGRVCGTGSYLPIRTVSNDELSHVMETSDEWIRERTGIRFRHVALEETTSDMAAEAAARALKNGEVNADEIELILTATSSSDVIYPSAACIVQKRIGAQNALAFDLNGACSGFVIAFNTAQAYIRAGIYKTILVVGAESMSRLVDWSDRSTSVLFGDGAGAAVFELCKDAPYEHVVGVRGDTLIRVGGPCREQRMTMDGQAVFRFAVTTIPQCVNELCQKAGVTPDDVDWVICHQANVRILDASIRRLGMPAEKFYRNLDRYANTSAASIPLALDEMREKGLLQSGQRIILVGFGGGLTWAGVMMEV